MNKYFLTPLYQRFSALWVSKNKIEQWSKEWQFFFILGFGRSGTMFMANFLNQAAGAYVFHEPVVEDFGAHARAHYSQHEAEKYMLGFRKKEIYVRTYKLHPAGIYGEVTGTLRCHVSAINKSFPEAKLLHLVRDGREVVRSTILRRTMTIKNPFSMTIHPIESDPWKDRWSEMDRFARICWYWQEENKRLRISIGNTVQFEKILESYDYLSERLLQPLNLNIERNVWESSKAVPRNQSSSFGMPKWDLWTFEQQKVFREICGDEMNRNGYFF